MRKWLVLPLILLATYAVGTSLYMINGNDAAYMSKVSYWNGVPFVRISDVATFLGLKWSYKNGMGMISNGSDFISFNPESHSGLYDALYPVENAATGTGLPWVSMDVLKKLTGIGYTLDPVGICMVRKSPSTELNGAVLYRGNFTLFFKTIPASSVVSVVNAGMVATVTVFPVSFSKGYLSPRTPLIVEKDGEYSSTYRITHLSSLTVSASVGLPGLPAQTSKEIDFPGGVRYRTVVSTSLSGKAIRLSMLMVPEGTDMKLVYPKGGFGNTALLGSIVSNGALGAIGFNRNETTGFISSNGEFLGAPLQNWSTLIWNDQKFDILEKSPVVTVNIGNVPFTINGINGGDGDVIMYTPLYGPKIPESTGRIYLEVKEGRIVGTSYVEHAMDDVVLSLTKGYELFIKSVNLGDMVSFFTSFGSIYQKVENAIQGYPLLIYNSQKIPFWSPDSGANTATSRIVAAIKEKTLYFIRADSLNGKDGVTLSELSDTLLNMGFSKALCLGSGDGASMVVEGKVVDELNQGLHPVEFGIEIDKTTGGV